MDIALLESESRYVYTTTMPTTLDASASGESTSTRCIGYVVPILGRRAKG